MKPFLLRLFDEPNVEYQFFYSADTSTPKYRVFHIVNSEESKYVDIVLEGQEAIVAAEFLLKEILNNIS